VEREKMKRAELEKEGRPWNQEARAAFCEQVIRVVRQGWYPRQGEWARLDEGSMSTAELAFGDEERRRFLEWIEKIMWPQVAGETLEIDGRLYRAGRFSDTGKFFIREVPPGWVREGWRAAELYGLREFVLSKKLGSGEIRAVWVWLDRGPAVRYLPPPPADYIKPPEPSFENVPSGWMKKDNVMPVYRAAGWARERIEEGLEDGTIPTKSFTIYHDDPQESSFEYVPVPVVGTDEIDGLKLPRGVRNALRRNGFHSVAAIASMPDWELLAYRTIGKKALAAIRAVAPYDQAAALGPAPEIVAPFGWILRVLRVAARRPRRKFADDAGLMEREVINVEFGLSRPSIEILTKWARVVCRQAATRPPLALATHVAEVEVVRGFLEYLYEIDLARTVSEGRPARRRLAERERLLLDARYSGPEGEVDGTRYRTLEDIAADPAWKISPARVRQIEQSGLRYLATRVLVDWRLLSADERAALHRYLPAVSAWYRPYSKPEEEKLHRAIDHYLELSKQQATPPPAQRSSAVCFAGVTPGKLAYGWSGDAWELPRLDGSGSWIPSGWLPPLEGEIGPHGNGYHGYTTERMLECLGPHICEIEFRGEVVELDGLLLGRQARLTRELTTWNERTARLFAADCAEACLEYADKQVRALLSDVVSVARRSADGQVGAQELATARRAALSAGRAAYGNQYVCNAAAACVEQVAWRAARDASRYCLAAAGAEASHAVWAAAHSSGRLTYTPADDAELLRRVEVTTAVAAEGAAAREAAAKAAYARQTAKLLEYLAALPEL